MRLRRMTWILAPLSSSIALGCFDSSVDDVPFFAPDSGASDGAAPLVDATMPEAGLAPDAGPGVDAAEEPAPPSPVTVVVRGPGGPESGKTIVFSDAAGALLATATTDAHGVAAQILPAGSQVTALLGTSDFPQLVTVTGVQPGDTLTAVDGALQTTSQAGFQLPAAAPPDTTTQYEVLAGNCYQELASVDASAGLIDLDPTCVNSAGQFPLLALAQDDVGATVGFAFDKGIAIDADGGAPAAVIPPPWVTVLGQEAITLGHIADSTAPYLSLSEFSSGVPHTQYDFDLTPVDGGAAANFETHPGYADFVQAELGLQGSTSAGSTINAIATRATAPSVASPTQTLSIDADAALPTITGASLDSTDVLRPRVTFTSTSPLTDAAGTFMTLSWQDGDADGGARAGTWTLVVPSSVTSAQAPALPASVALGPAATALWDATPTVAALGGGPFAGYDALRSTAAEVGVALKPASVPLVPALPADGTMKVTVFYETANVEGVVTPSL